MGNSSQENEKKETGNGKKSVNIGKQKKLGMLVSILLIVFLVVIVVIVVIVANNKEGDPNVTSSSHVTNTPGTTGGDPFVNPPVTSAGTQGTEPGAFTGTGEKIALDKAKVYDGNLLYVSSDYKFKGALLYESTEALKEAYNTKDELESKGLYTIKGLDKNFSVAYGAVALRKEAAEAYIKMVKAFVEASKTELGKVIARTGYLPLDTSDSVSGYVVTLKYGDNKLNELKFTSGDKEITYEEWFKTNGATYGFIYQGTGDMRYVGVHAKYMSDNNKNVKDYITAIKETGTAGLKITDINGASWTVKYVEANKTGSTDITIGKGVEYFISGDNYGGFIVTTKN